MTEMNYLTLWSLEQAELTTMTAAVEQQLLEAESKNAVAANDI